MTKTTLSLLLALAAAGLTACDKSPETYPISNEQCGPEDPVKTLSASDCDVPLPAI